MLGAVRRTQSAVFGQLLLDSYKVKDKNDWDSVPSNTETTIDYEDVTALEIS